MPDPPLPPGALDRLARDVARERTRSAPGAAPAFGWTPDPGSPATLGRFRIVATLGRGGMGIVYRAVDPRTQAEVALKSLAAGPAERLRREGEAIARLNHPGLVRVLESGEDRGSPFLVMELVRGRPLDEAWAAWDLRRRVEAVERIARAIAHAHGRGVAHRDLKPGNVLVGEDGAPRVTDFGLAAVDDSFSDEALLDVNNPRTIDYAALERATGVRKDDTRSDIYFMGCMYYQMLTGAAPLAETTDRSHRLSKTRFLQIAPIQKLEPSVPNNVAMVVNKAMMLDPERRYQTPGGLLADLRSTARRLSEGDTGEEVEPDSPQPVSAQSDELHSIMIVESNPRMQNVFRDGFKRAGYRVLLTSDPKRAVDRFQEDKAPADCIVLNAQELGESAVVAFNELGEHSKTAFVPALLLLDEQQSGWAQEARTAPHRAILTMPITMKDLRAELAKIVPAKQASETQEQEPGSEVR
ncbi:MAG: protein kinase [Planctomycetaceae bacterium]|nr:protein kinase [Planctomycetaceae bacterium]